MQVDVPESIVVEIARHQIVMALTNVLKNAFEAFVAAASCVRGGSKSSPPWLATT